MAFLLVILLIHNLAENVDRDIIKIVRAHTQRGDLRSGEDTTTSSCDSYARKGTSSVRGTEIFYHARIL